MRIYEQECYIRDIKGIADDEVYIMVQKETDQWPLTKIGKWPFQTNVSFQKKLSEHQGKIKNNMDQFDKKHINDISSSYVKIYFYLIK